MPLRIAMSSNTDKPVFIFLLMHILFQVDLSRETVGSNFVTERAGLGSRPGCGTVLQLYFFCLFSVTLVVPNHLCEQLFKCVCKVVTVYQVLLG